MSLQDTPRSNRLHIGIYGKRNSGKSSLINALTNQNIATVSSIAGTTTDPVYKAMELHGIGPVVFIDTAGFDDEGELGELRIEKTKEASKKTDIALLVIDSPHLDEEYIWVKQFKDQNIPIIPVIHKTDIHSNETIQTIQENIRMAWGFHALLVSSVTFDGIADIREAIIRHLPENYEVKSITGSLVGPGDLVLLVMPQDIQAPKGRLILPQVQTTRDLLDNRCLIVSCTMDSYEAALHSLKQPPKLIITDSQVFKQVFDKKPAESMLTSFSILFAHSKGDILYFVDSAQAIASLHDNSKILIAEACTHAPLAEDIGREKIPAMLRKKYGSNMKIDIASGVDFPDDISSYDLVIHCGACMFNRKYVLSRIEKTKAQNIPMTNYGVVLAYLTGILDRIDLPTH